MDVAKKKKILFKAFPKQAEFAEAVFSNKYRYLMYGGAIKGGKTVLCITLIFTFARMFPGSRWAIVRSDLSRIQRNIIPVYNKMRPDFVEKINYRTWTSKCKNGSEIILFPESYAIDKDLDRFKGLDVNGFLLEEANELQEKTFYKAIERAGSWIVPNLEVQPPPLILLNTNPANNWVYQLFYKPWKEGKLKPPYYFLPANIYDNLYLSKEYKQSLKSLPPNIYNRFVKGDWTAIEDPDQLIKYEWIAQALSIKKEKGKQKVGIDVARYGDDKSVIARINGNALVDIVEFDQYDINRFSAICQNYITQHSIDADMVGVDAIGLGAGVVDNLRNAGFDVIEIIAGGKPVFIPDDIIPQEFTFYNLRSQMWFYCREMLRLGKIAIHVNNQQLIEDLTAPRYKISGDKVLRVESKDEVKKRIGRSTDFADAFIQALVVEHLNYKIGIIQI